MRSHAASANHTADDFDMDIDSNQPNESYENTGNMHTRDYQRVFDDLSDWANEDSQPVVFRGPRPVNPGPFNYKQIPLAQLLNFQNVFWVDYQHKTGIRNNRDEERLMEYYATGEPANDANQGTIDESGGGIFDMDNTVSASLFV
jgi:hypothetical protein